MEKNKDEFKIIERHGVFIVYQAYYVFSLWKMKNIKKWTVSFKGIYKPAHFETLEDAREWVKLRMKQDVEHSIY
jgi:hypothetical protein